MGKMDEQIVVVPRKTIFGENNELFFDGFLPDGEQCEKILCRLAENVRLMRRGDAEENVDFKQPIPYVVLMREVDGEKQVFAYKRLQGGGEARLHSKISIGVGGHMNEPASGVDFNDMMAIIRTEAIRELEEELAFIGQSRMFSVRIFGLINDDELDLTDGDLYKRDSEGSIPVGRVHLGIVARVLVPDDIKVVVRETDQLDGGWMTLDELRSPEVFERLESWSQIVVNALA